MEQSGYIKKLSLDEVKKRQIRMLEIFDKFCRVHEIPYFLSYGTLLGAIRHKGYIPWDDDVDVMVPRPYLKTLIRLFNIPDYSILSVDNCSNYDFPYPRIVDNSTFSKIGPKATIYGINIDIYPIDAYPNNKKEENEYRNKINKAKKQRLFVLKWVKRLVGRMPIPYWAVARPFVRKHENALASADYQIANKVHVFQLESEPLDKSLFEERIEVEFEGKKYFAPKDWDVVLRNWYGDYMQLPPEDKRHFYHRTENIYLIQK